MDRTEESKEPQFMGEVTMSADQIAERMQRLLINVQENMAVNQDNKDQEKMIQWGSGFFSSESSNANFQKMFGRAMTLHDASMVSATMLYFWAVNSLIWDKMQAAKN